MEGDLPRARRVRNARGVPEQEEQEGAGMLENIRLSFQGIWSHRMRSVLTMLGIIIGIASIMSIVSTMKGTNEEIKKNLIGSGKNTVNVRLYESDVEWESFGSSIPAGLRPVSQKAMNRILNVKGIVGASAYHSRIITEDGGILCGNENHSGLSVCGTDQQYLETAGLRVRSGRPFTDDDYEQFRTVALLDGTAARIIFREENPLGREVEILGYPFTIIGVVEDTNNFEPVINTLSDYYMTHQEKGGAIYIPGADWPVLFGFDEPETIIVKAAAVDDMTRIGRKTADILNEYIHVKDGRIKYAAEDLLGTVSEMQQLNSASNRQQLLVAVIALLVGGIGVMNIMLVSVTERTPEIGLKKAIGAKKHVILAQFLTEASVLTSLGGILGVAAGISVSFVISRFTGNPMAVDIPFSLLAVGVSSMIGLLFGFVPAIHAAGLDPIQCLRRE